MLPIASSDNPAAFAKLAALNPAPSTAPAAGAARAAPAADIEAAGDEAFVLLRPAAIKAGLVSEICKRLQQRGLRLVGMKMLKPGADVARSHYGPRKPAAASGTDADAYKSLVLELAAGPAIATLWRSEGALAAAVALIGDAEPSRALPGTVRGDYSFAIAKSLVDVSTTAAEAARLRQLWLAPADIVDGGATAAPTAAASPPITAAAAPTVAAAPSSAAAAAPPPGAPSRPSNARAGSRFYITTAINYANGAPHMGHAYEAVTADVIARYHRAFGREVFFLTGSDEHGQKIADTAAEAGLEPIELVDRAVTGFKRLNEKLNISNDFYVRTTSADHKRRCQAFWLQVIYI